MRVRSWLIRGLILAGVAALAACAWVANSWISPDRVREKVVDALSKQFEGVDIHVGSARMRILGGIAVTDLRLTRQGDPVDKPFLLVPNAVLYHDKEKLNDGNLVIRKVEMDGPTFRVERTSDGKWNLAEVLKPSPADKPVPTFVLKNATVIVADRSRGALPPTTLSDVKLTLQNDQLDVLKVEASANAKGYGPLVVRGRLNRISNHLALSVELNDFPLGAAAVPTAERFAPELVTHLARFTANANVKADLNYAPDRVPQWQHDVRLEVKDARFEHPELPWPVEKITATVHSVDGRVKVEDASAQIGQAKVRVSLETRTDGPALPQAKGPADDPLRRFEDNLQRLDVSAAGIVLDDGLFNRLPDKMKRGRQMFSPSGQVDLGYKFTRKGAGWEREMELRPKQAAMIYEKFRYPVSDVRGLVKRTVTHTGSETTSVNLIGTAAGQLITVSGHIDGAGENPAVAIQITGSNVPIDEQLYTALPPQYATLVREFRASGRGNFMAKITRQAGVDRTENEFRITVNEGKLNYTAFPYPLEKLKGRLVIRTTSTGPDRPGLPGAPTEAPADRDEVVFDEFTAVHAGAPLRIHGDRRPIPNTTDHKLTLHVEGTEVPLDGDLKAALGTAKVGTLWDTIAPKGHLSFTTHVEVVARPPANRAGGRGAPDELPFDPAKDLKITFEFSGPTVTPAFFPYELTLLKGWLRYENNKLDLAHVSARHGAVDVKLLAADVRFYPDDVVWANIGEIKMAPFVPDAALKKALPGRLGAALDELQLRGRADLVVKQLVVLTPPDPRPAPLAPHDPVARGQLAAAPVPAPFLRPDPVVYWDAELKLAGAALDTGVEWEDTHGAIACCGRYEGTHVGIIRGNVWLDRAVISRMPVTNAKCKLTANEQVPDPARPGQYVPTTLQFSEATGWLFHGELGGQARLVLSEPTRYEVFLRVTDANLEEVARHYKLGSDADLKGIAQAQINVFNRPDPQSGRLVVVGTGKIDVPTGRMYNLPIMLDLVKLFKGSAPDKTAFEQAHVVFRVQGDRLKVDQLDLIGRAVCVGGSGELDLTGEYVKFEFYTVWSQALKQMASQPVVGDLTKFFSENLFTIKLARENGELKYKAVPVPLVTEPTKAVLERLRRAGAKVFGK